MWETGRCFKQSGKHTSINNDDKPESKTNECGKDAPFAHPYMCSSMTCMYMKFMYVCVQTHIWYQVRVVSTFQCLASVLNKSRRSNTSTQVVLYKL
jgi:hypothetical protein